MQLQPNDAIVLASDGIFDNIFPEDFPKLLEPYLAHARQYGRMPSTSRCGCRQGGRLTPKL